MANGNPGVPVMDWTEDAELHKRNVEWKKEVELELGSSLSAPVSQTRLQELRLATQSAQAAQYYIQS